MKIFKLPDLGEGLPDAIIREWYIKVGDEVKVDQPIVAMETAKALVDVPAPFPGTIEKLFGDNGDTIETGQPLIGFEGQGEEETTKDTGTVVGAIEEGNVVIEETAVATRTHNALKATPAVRALARRLDIDLAGVTPTGTTPSGSKRITKLDVQRAAEQLSKDLPSDMQALSPARRAMVLSMSRAHKEIVPVTVCDDADIAAWDENQDITLRLIRAMANACHAEPMLNSHYDGKRVAIKQQDSVNLGLAVDTEHGLYVPVLKDVANQTDEELRQKINQFKQQAQDKAIPQADLHGGTIMLSNFGRFAGRYANPMIVQPMVAIVGVGRMQDAVVAIDGKPAIHRMIPLSVTFDHRAVTGGEATRFLRAMMDDLQKS